MSRALVLSLVFLLTSFPAIHAQTIDMTVDAGQSLGRLTHIWNGVGGDPNLVVMRRGERLLKILSSLSPEPFYRRAQGLTSSGNGTGATTNIYHTDENGNAFYDFTIFNQIYDQLTRFHFVPVVSIGFMPDELTSAPAADLDAPWKRRRYPPRDYDRWYDLVRAIVSHAVQRYGKESVSRWYWEVWNEPDLQFYWNASPEEFMKLYDYTAAAVKAALPEARVGGNAADSPNTENFFWSFLEHCLRGRNSYTGDVGAPLDFISFHVKGGSTGSLGFFTSNALRTRGYTRKNPSLSHIMRATRNTLQRISSMQDAKGIPVMLTEADIDWGVATSIYNNPNMVYRNNEYFAGFQVALSKQMLDLHREFPSNRVLLMIMDTFYFEGSRTFEGQRTLITADDIEKPILNALRMLGRMGNTRLPLAMTGNGSVDGFAARSDNGEIQVLVYNWVEAFDFKDIKRVNLALMNLPSKHYTLTHYRIDDRHSNAHTVWQSLGEPLIPDRNQLARIRMRQGLERLEPTRSLAVKDQGLTILLGLPPYSVSLLILDPRS